VADRNQGAHGCDYADAEERNQVIAGRAQSAARQRIRAQVTHHHGVGEDHQHMRHLRSDQRPGQTQDGPEFFDPWCLSGDRLHGRGARKTGFHEQLILDISGALHKGIKLIIGMTKTHPG
jgi:hypothetical protein